MEERETSILTKWIESEITKKANKKGEAENGI